ncbi:formate dehydrogenase subunit gamma [Haliea sp. E1-2-M8]|uniref:formate dehydrogenase subunit gamma n=1 Tax=Haliea sp. E1-2-M8 TaxID=3064706 RepID=UPI00272639B3|nr:formate dehydrogenase subunit gamma [Haliea sp. E1-2-M8]MDO8860139.1 formate dehydrogenase subunit gamma [Haliea sp. E1-2-M8]
MENAAYIAERVRNIADGQRDLPGALLPILHAVQDALGFIPEAAIPIIAEVLNLSRAEVHGVVSFYHHFRRQLPGQHIVQICRAESCQAVGARALEAEARAQLGIDYHQTTADRCITLEPVYCLGNCACSPAVRVNDEIHGLMDAAKLSALLAALRSQVVEVR